MVLKPIIEELDGIPEPLREHYIERGGKFVLAVEGVEVDRVPGLKASVRTERERADEAERKLKEFAELDPEKAREALEKVEAMATWTPEEKVREQIEAREKSLKAKWQKDVDDRDAALKSRTDQLVEELIEKQAIAAIAKSKGNVDLLLPHVKRWAKVVDDGGRLVPRILDDTGGIRETSDPKRSGPMGFDELVEEMRSNETFMAAFSGTGGTGGGSQNPGGKSGGRSAIDWDTLQGADLLEAARRASPPPNGR